MKIFNVFSFGIVLFLAGCSSNNVNNKDSESKDMINTVVEPVKMSESKGRKIKDVENDIRKAEAKELNIGYIAEKVETKKDQYSGNANAQDDLNRARIEKSIRTAGLPSKQVNLLQKTKTAGDISIAPGKLIKIEKERKAALEKATEQKAE